MWIPTQRLFISLMYSGSKADFKSVHQFSKISKFLKLLLNNIPVKFKLSKKKKKKKEKFTTVTNSNNKW